MSIHDFQAKTVDGEEVSLSRYRGKALLVVDAASRCGYTPPYQGLEERYEACQARGFEVLAFPCKDFGAQEPGTNEEIREFCELRCRVALPPFAKIPARGRDAHPLYRHLASLPEHGGEVTWNFNKFVVDTRGTVVAHLDSGVASGSPALREILERLLPAKPDGGARP